MLNRCSENYIETTSKEHVEIPSGKRRQKNFHFQPVCQRCFNATGHIGLTLNQRQNACRDVPSLQHTLQALYVGSTLKFSLEQRHDVISTTFQRCFNVRCPQGRA